MMPADHWLGKVERLRAGDACETKCTRTGEWKLATVLLNGGSGYWIVKVETEEKPWHRYIEHVRLPGQTEAWAADE